MLFESHPTIMAITVRHVNTIQIFDNIFSSGNSYIFFFGSPFEF